MVIENENDKKRSVNGPGMVISDGKENDDLVTDAKSFSKMAEEVPAHGMKRGLSLSPALTKTVEELGNSNLNYKTDQNSYQYAKKRAFTAQYNRKTTEEEETGSDPAGGQHQTGNNPSEEQVRTKTNMAAPIESERTDQNKLMRDETMAFLMPLFELPTEILELDNSNDNLQILGTDLTRLVTSSKSFSTRETVKKTDNSTYFPTDGGRLETQEFDTITPFTTPNHDSAQIINRSANETSIFPPMTTTQALPGTTAGVPILPGTTATLGAYSGKSITAGQEITTHDYSVDSGDHFNISYVSIGHLLREQCDGTIGRMTTFDRYDNDSSNTANSGDVNTGIPSDPPVGVDGSVTPSNPAVGIDGSMPPSDPRVGVDGSLTPSDPPVGVDGSVTPSDPPVGVDGSLTPSDPPVGVDGSLTPSDPPVGVDGSLTPSDPPVGVDGSVTPSDPRVGVDGSVTPSDPPVGVDGSVNPSDPPVGVDRSVTPSDPPVGVDNCVAPSDPPVGVDRSVTPSDPPVGVDNCVAPSDPPVRVDGSVAPSDSAIRDDSNMTPSDEILVPHNSPQEKVPNVNPPSPQNKTPTITKPNLRSRQPRPQRYREDPPPPPKRKTFHLTQRAKVLKKKVLKTPPKKCNDCSVRNTGVPATEKPAVANEKASKETKKKRGRPKKQSKNEEHDPTDFHKLLREISDTQSRQICTLIDDKITDLKSSIGIEIHNVKENVQKNTTAVSNLQSYQKSVDSKVGNLEKDIRKHSTILSNFEHSQSTLVSRIETLDGNLISLNEKTCDLDRKLDSIKQDHESEQTNRALSQQVLDVEHGLAAHIETIKGNMEEELSGAKQNQIYLENRLMDFTTEIHHQNIEMNANIQSLKNDFDQLKALSETASDTFRTTSASNFFSNSSSPSVSTDTSRENYQTFQNSNPQGSTPPNNGSPDSSFYMYGDTTRTLIVDGIKENAQENLKQIMLRCINEMGVPITPEDIVNVERIGRFSRNRKWPRPVKITLIDQTIRDQIYIFKRRLRFSVPFGALKINKEERKDVRVRAAKIRQAALKAKSLGHKVEIKADGRIRIDNVEYNTLTLSSIPERFMTEANKIRQPPLNTHRLSLLQKCTTNSGKTIMVGPSLQKTPLGLAFY